MTPDPTSEISFELHVQLETPKTPWHATLEREGVEVLEFSSPLELARHLASLKIKPSLELPFKGLR